MRAPPPCQEKVRRVRFTHKTNSQLQSVRLPSVEEFFNAAAKFFDRFPPRTMRQYLYENKTKQQKKMGEKLFFFFFFLMALFLDSRDQNRTTKSNFPPDWRRQSEHDTWGWKHPTAAPLFSGLESEQQNRTTNRTTSRTSGELWFNIVAGFLLLSTILVCFVLFFYSQINHDIHPSGGRM